MVFVLQAEALKHCASACNTDTTQTQPHQISNTQRTENNSTDVVIQQHKSQAPDEEYINPYRTNVENSVSS